MFGGVVRSAISVMVVLATTALSGGVLTAAGAKAPFYSLTASLSIAADLSDESRRVLISETQRIWERVGVRLIWPTDASADAGAPLRVLVIARPQGKSDKERWTVGELVPQTGQRALAIASIAAAERVVVEADLRRLQLLGSRESEEYRLGLVLGRAVAHEIGHYLLSTRTHADRGLMRASIDSREFADPTARTFALDDVAGDWLRHRLAEAADGSLPSIGFTYGVAQPPSIPHP